VGSIAKFALAGTLALGLTACATPRVVQVKQLGDESMSCQQIQAAIAEANRFEQAARSERGVTGKNVAAAVFFPLGLVGTYVNTDEAIDAARMRRDQMMELYRRKNCG